MLVDESAIRWNEQGLLPAVIQDNDTNQVLMMAWMSADSLQLTRETGQTHFWSRSRGELWHTRGQLAETHRKSFQCTLIVTVIQCW